MFSKQRAKIELTLPGEDFELLLFGEQAGSYLLLVADQREKTFLKEVASLENNKVIKIGKATEGSDFFINNQQINDNKVHHTFSRSLQL